MNTTHEIANCQQCNWECDDRDAKEQARNHSRKTGHRVTGEVVIPFSFPMTQADIDREKKANARGLVKAASEQFLT